MRSRQHRPDERLLPAGVSEGCELVSATLRLNATSWTTARLLEARLLSGPWTEGDVTWANQPVAVGLPSLAISGPGYRLWDVTSQAIEMLATGADEGFVIQDAVVGSSGASPIDRTVKNPGILHVEPAPLRARDAT
jgi:hypothetical protein